MCLQHRDTAAIPRPADDGGGLGPIRSLLHNYLDNRSEIAIMRTGRWGDAQHERPKGRLGTIDNNKPFEKAGQATDRPSTYHQFPTCPFSQRAFVFGGV